MNSRKTILIIVYFFVFFTACISSFAQRGIFRTKTSVTLLKEAPPKSKDAPIEILGSKPTDRKHEDVCIINAKGGQTIFNAKDSSDLLEKIKQDARKCGADAIIIRSSEDRTWKASEGGGFEQAKSSELAIRFLKE
jgi:hypothetical protein